MQTPIFLDESAGNLRRGRVRLVGKVAWYLLHTLVRVTAALVFIGVMLVFGAYWIRNGSYLLGGAMVLGAMGLVVLEFMKAVIFRYHIRQGMGRELRKRNCCPYCEYDLRASPLRCPECGRGLPGANVEI